MVLYPGVEHFILLLLCYIMKEDGVTLTLEEIVKFNHLFIHYLTGFLS